MRTAAAAVLCLAFFGCSDDPLSSASAIQHALDHDPALRTGGYAVTVERLDHGYLTLLVKGMKPESAHALMGGASLEDAVMSGADNVRPLKEADDMIRKRFDIKSIEWEPAP